MNLLRYIISAPNKASEYVWTPGRELAEALAEYYFNTKQGISVRQVDKYEFAMRVGAATIRTFGNTLEDCINNKKVIGFTGEHDIDKELENEFKRQQALALIKIKDDLAKLKKINLGY